MGLPRLPHLLGIEGLAPETISGLLDLSESYIDQNRSIDSLASSVTTVAHEVEDEHGIPIEVVVTGDRPMDDGGQALVKATREALLNAVRHGAAPVSVYVEVGPSGVEAFVRDHGPGFEMTNIGDDRLGVRESILGRMRRHGGAARIRRLESGSEIELTLPPLTGADEVTPETGKATPETAKATAEAGKATAETGKATPETAKATANTAEASATEPIATNPSATEPSATEPSPTQLSAAETAPLTPSPDVREAQPTGGRTT